MNKPKLPPASKLVKCQDFDSEFTKLIALHGFTREKAFNTLNDHYFNATKKERYSDYESYRVARYRRLKQ